MAFSDRKNLLLQPAPILTFWDCSDVHLVDFGDSEVESATVAGKITFDGVEYEPAKLSPTERRETTEGGESDVALSIEDTNGAIAKLLQTVEGYVGERVTMRRIYMDKIDDPSQADTHVFIMRAPTCTDEGIAFTLGQPSTSETRSPRRTFSRTACWLDYGSRHQYGNRCTMPSDAFTFRTRQRFAHADIADTEFEHFFGWYSRNMSKAEKFEAGFDTFAGFRGSGLKATINGPQSIRWLDGNREGPAVYKKISGDFDVETNISVSGNARVEWIAGILVQDAADPANWVIWGRGEVVGVQTAQFRRTLASSSSTTNYSQVGETDKTQFRLERAGNLFSAYWGTPNPITERLPGPDSEGWTLKGSDTVAMGESVNIGIVVCSDDTTDIDDGEADFERFHFLSGGPSVCDRTLATCASYKNTNDYNGFDDLPGVRPNI